MRRPLLLAVLFLLLSPTAKAQRPRTASEALDRFRQVAERPEAERRWAAADLGDHADEAVTELLLAELARAQELGYRQAVVRALGERPRQGVISALQQVVQEATNARLKDSAAEGLARQGQAGVAALGRALEQCKDDNTLRAALCTGLGRADGDEARDLLVAAAQRGAGRDRLPPLRALQRRVGDAVVDEIRLLLARDKDPFVAAAALQQLASHRHAQSPALALELHRRLPALASTEQHTAVLHGLLVQPAAVHHEPLLVEAALADDAFGGARQELWQQALGDAALVVWFGAAASNRKDNGERAIAATALGFTARTHRAPAVAALGKVLLAQRAPEIVAAAARSLVVLAPDDARPLLQKLLASGAEPLLPVALEALHSLCENEPAWRMELLQHAVGKTPGARTAAMQLLARCRDLDASAVTVAAANLAHKSWQVRAAAIDLLADLRQPAGIPLLFERLDLEQGRLRADLVATLHELTSLQFPATAAWRDWWSKEGPGFQVPRRTKAADETRNRRGLGQGTSAYWNIPVCSDRITFVVDASGSMNQPFGTGSATRIDEAKRQLVAVLDALPGKAKANVVTFGNDAQAFAETLQVFDEKRRAAAAGVIAGMVARGATNVHAALHRAFADPEVDTIFLLTDGQPSAGAIVEPGALLREVQRWNVGRSVRIHTVAIGGKSDFLERLAADAGGEHTVAR